MLPFALIGGALALALLLIITVARSPYRAPAILYGALVIGFASVASAVPLTKSATANVIVVPWGTLLSQLLVALTPTLVGLIALLLAWVYSKLPANIVIALKAAHADQLLNRALFKAIALVEGAEKGKTVSVDIANELIRQGAVFLLDEAPWLVKQLGARLGPVLAGKLAEQGMLPASASAKSLQLNPLHPIDLEPGAVRINPPKAVAK